LKEEGMTVYLVHFLGNKKTPKLINKALAQIILLDLTFPFSN